MSRSWLKDRNLDVEPFIRIAESCGSNVGRLTQEVTFQPLLINRQLCELILLHHKSTCLRSH